MLLDDVEVRKGKYGEAATGDITHGCDVWLALVIDETVEIVGSLRTPTSSCGNN